ncbi:hypothetical protein FF1_035072 [Malus domestica]
MEIISNIVPTVGNLSLGRVPIDLLCVLYESATESTHHLMLECPLTDFLRVTCSHSQPVSHGVLPRWYCPPTGRLKLNVHEAWDKEQCLGGVGIIIRNAEGNFVEEETVAKPWFISRQIDSDQREPPPDSSLFKMTQDVEMKEVLAPSNSVSSTSPSTLHNLKEIASLLETAAYTREVRRIVRAVRLTMVLRRKLKVSVISAFLSFALTPGSEVHSRLSSFLPKDDEQDMDVDTATSATQVPAKHALPELEMYSYLLVLIFLIDQKKYNEAKACASASIARIKNLNRRTIDVLASRLYFYYSLSYELTGDLAEIRGNLLNLHRIATLRHDELGQETLLNLLLRNYLHYNLYDQAEKLRSKAPRFEAHSNQQFCRYLFYLGKIRTIQLEYTDAKESLLQAARKAPIAALGFRIQCNKWAIIVRLLLGEIPERTVFMQKGMEKALRPYFELTNAVRIGDLELFKNIAEKFSNVFNADRTHNLIVRLRHNVIRTGLRNISISYSRISLVDVAKKLRLDSPNPVADAESIVAKAIRDGAIDATLDHANGWMVSKETGDIYSTNEPQAAFDTRIAFCLNLHNDAVRALRFPPNSHKEKESAEKRRERQQQEQELAKHIAEEDDDEF